MGNCGSNTIVIGRPSKAAFDSAQCAGSLKADVGGCGGSGGCGPYTTPHGRTLGPRKTREKVREDIKDYVLLMLGAPTIKIELDRQALDLCVDQALKIFEEYAGAEYYDYHKFNTVPGKSVYKMPDDIGIVRNVYYRQTPRSSFMASDLGGSIPIEYFQPGSSAGIGGGILNPTQPTWGNAGEWVGYKMYEQMFSRISSQIGGWEWISDMGYIKLYPIPCGSVPVFVRYLQKCKDWREVNQAMQEGALCHAMIMLGHIRGKYMTPPGGSKTGMQLDGDYMRTKGWEMKEKWQEELLSRYGDPLPITLG
jgi:hypothetical protein